MIHSISYRFPISHSDSLTRETTIPHFVVHIFLLHLFAFYKYWHKRLPCYISCKLRTSCISNRRHYVLTTTQVIAYLSSLDIIFPIHNERYSMTTFKHIAFISSQRTITFMEFVIVSFVLRSIIRRE